MRSAGKTGSSIWARGAVTISQLVGHLAWAGVNLDGNDELTGEELAHYRGDKRLAALPVIATGSNEFVLITLALLVNRTVKLDFSNPALVKLIWDGRGNIPCCDYKTRTAGHYHVLFVRDPGGPEQVAQSWEGKYDLTFACQYLDEIYLRDTIDEGWEAIWVVGCGPDRCRRDEICSLPVEERGSRTGVATLSTPQPPTKTSILSPMLTRTNRPSDRDDQHGRSRRSRKETCRQSHARCELTSLARC